DVDAGLPCSLPFSSSALRSVEASALLFLPCDRTRRPLARTRVGVGPLAAHRQPPAMPQSAIAAEIHQPLDVHRDGSPQIALDRVFAVDQLAHPQHLVVGHLVRPALGRDADLAADLGGLGPADAMDVGQGDRYALVIRDVDASNSRHLRISLEYRERGGYASDQPTDHTDR